MIYARQSTAITVTIGPVLDASGVAVTDRVVGNFKISKNGGAPAGLNASATLTHRNTGHYSLALTATDVATVGTVEVVIDDTTNACPPKEIQVVEEVIYDALFAASANTFTGAAGSTKVTSLVLADTVTTLTNLPAITNNWLTTAGIADGAVTNAKVADDLTVGSVTGAVGSVTGAVGSVTGNVGGNVTGSVGSVVGAVGSVTGAVGSVTGNVGGNVTGSVGSLATQAKADVNAEVDTALADYDAPTNAEMVARTLAAASYATAANQTTITTHLTDIKGAGWTTTDTLEAIRDRGDAAWITATGFSTHSAADVWAVATRVLTAATNITSTGGTITVSTGAVTVGTNNDKAGYALSASGLDSIAATDPGGVATTWPQMMVQLWRRMFRKSTLTATELKTYADDGTTVRTTQTVSDDGTTQTQGTAS